MSSFGLSSPSARTRPQRQWLLETLVVLGVLAFGYFAVTVDATAMMSDAVVEDAADPFADLLN